MDEDYSREIEEENAPKKTCQADPCCWLVGFDGPDYNRTDTVLPDTYIVYVNYSTPTTQKLTGISFGAEPSGCDPTSYSWYFHRPVTFTGQTEITFILDQAPGECIFDMIKAFASQYPGSGDQLYSERFVVKKTTLNY